MAGSGTAHLRPADQTLLRIEDLVVEFPVGRTGLKVHAVTNVSIDVLPGETLGLVGESGCGKSTMGKAVMQLVRPSSGSVIFEHTELTSLKGELLRALRPKLQMIFQDPISSLNPRRRVRDIVREGLDIWKIGDKASRNDRVNEVLDTVGIDPTVAGPKRPHEFSGGQCQRISIARAVATEPKLIICDEPVSALDVSVQAQILNLLQDMKRKYGLTLIFIAHDLAVVKNVSDRIAVMYLGKLCEFAQPDELYEAPAHPYTAALLSAIPEPDPNADVTARAGVGGEIPSPLLPPSGCRFRTRCPQAEDVCATDEPLMHEVRPAHFVACHFPLGEITVRAPAAPAATAAAPVAPVAPPVAAAPVASVVTPLPASPTPTPPVAPAPVATPAPPPPAPAPPPVPPVPPVAAVVAAAAAVSSQPDDSWLRAPDSPTPERTQPEIDWTPEPPPPPPIVVTPPPAPPPAPAPAPPPPSPPPPPAPAPAPAPAPPPVTTPPVAPAPPPPAAPPSPPPTVAPAPPPLSAPPVAPAAPTIPDVASLDTLLPDRSKGGSVDPGR